ncbi:MAG TPA: hypothetical protein VFV38_00595 [Ktedonobacteraceae bacterium]|nr:hypothetical protein [Ktedonobacteraceae bacterium]
MVVVAVIAVVAAPVVIAAAGAAAEVAADGAVAGAVAEGAVDAAATGGEAAAAGGEAAATGGEAAADARPIQRRTPQRIPQPMPHRQPTLLLGNAKLEGADFSSSLAPWLFCSSYSWITSFIFWLGVPE